MTEYNFIDEYNLSTPFDISTAVYAGDDERCVLDHGNGIDTNPIMILNLVVME